MCLLTPKRKQEPVDMLARTSGLPFVRFASRSPAWAVGPLPARIIPSTAPFSFCLAAGKKTIIIQEEPSPRAQKQIKNKPSSSYYSQLNYHVRLPARPSLRWLGPDWTVLPNGRQLVRAACCVLMVSEFRPSGEYDAAYFFCCNSAQLQRDSLPL